MKKRAHLIAALVAMVLVPLAALTVLAVRVVREEAQIVSRQSEELSQERLRAVVIAIHARVSERARSTLALLASVPNTPRAIRASGLRGVLVLARDGQRLFPPDDGPVSVSEQALLDRTRSLWRDGVLRSLAAGAGASEVGDAPDHGWYGWYHEGGLQLLLWRADAERIIALEVPRVTLQADLIASSPDTPPSQGNSPPSARTVLLDTRGRAIYQWGSYEPPQGTPPQAELPLDAPLSTWRVARWEPPSVADASGRWSLTLIAGLSVGAIALVLLGLAIFLYRERTREARLAAQRMSFVSQVSHELRTPLTNIRLYAELIMEDLEGAESGFESGAESGAGDDDDERLRQLRIVVEESERLTRLVGNVLSFARGQEGRLRLRLAEDVVNDIVVRAVDALRPTLVERGVQVTLTLEAPERVLVDADATEQILTNLLGNVAKYAASGGRVDVSVRAQGERVVLRVFDDGPGVPPADRGRIFEPFYRVSDRLTDGVAGAGIGLAIARRLARLHGGDLRLVDSEAGALFEAVLIARRVAPSEPSG